jgi:GNAT superfamily N-acetyltransferase
MDREEKIKVSPLRKKDILEIDKLREEFESYLQKLSAKKRKAMSSRERKAKLLKDGFGRNRAFSGFVARKGKKMFGYIFYNFGYDPDEMTGRAVHILDIFVTESSRRLGIGAKLMKKVASLCDQNDIKDIYFAVWDKNKKATKFYKKLGAELIEDMSFMHWNKASW